MAETVVEYGTTSYLRNNTFTNNNYVFAGWYVHRKSDNKWVYRSADNTDKGWYKEGSQPSGWVKALYSNGCKVSETSSVNDDTVTMYAQWKHFTVKYYPEGGSGSMADTTVYYDVPTNLRNNTFKKAGRHFTGWTAKRRSDNKWCYRNADDTKDGWYLEGKQPSGWVKDIYKNQNTVYHTSSVHEDIVEMHAQWGSPSTYTIYYNANGGKGSMDPTVVTYDVISYLRKNTFTNNNYKFAGWYVHVKSDNTWFYKDPASTKTRCYEEGKQPDGWVKALYTDGCKVSRTSYTDNDIVTMYAQWEAAPSNTNNVIANGTTGDCTWTVDDKGTLTISGNGAMGKYVTPWSEPWYINNIKKAVIENGVTNIGCMSFFYCTSLESVTIPESVTSIDSSAFNNCTSLKRITIPDSVGTIEEGTFLNCTSLQEITLANGLTSIESEAFEGCTSLTTVSIPDSVTSIDDWAFAECTNLVGITIPESVTEIGEEVFLNCPNLTIYGKVGSCAETYANSNNIPFTDIEEITFYGKTGECKWILYSDGTLNISGNGAMGDYGSGYYEKPLWSWFEFNKAVIENGVTNIGCYAFYSCNMTSITIPDSVTSIGDFAFYGTSKKLVSITIPSSVTSIGEYAFYGRNNNITIYGIKGSYAETYADSHDIPFVALKEIIDSGTTGDCHWELDDEGTLTISGNGAMADYNSINAPWKGDKVKSVIIEDGVTNIGAWAFAYCHNLSSVTIPDSVTSIGSYSFCGGCTKLTDITIPDSVTSIGSFAFSNCSGLTSVKIPSSVTNIGTGIFSSCSGLTNIKVDLDNEAYCSYFGNLYNKDRTTLLQYAPGYPNSSFVVPDSVNCIYNYAFHGCTILTSVIIPDSVTTIGYDAFSGCNKLTSVSIPESVTYIGVRAFENCPNLNSVIIPNSVTSIGTKAFGYYNDNVIDGFTITGYKGSTAENYANSNGITFIKNINGLIASGTTGDCTWTINKNGVLTISGNGDIEDYIYYEDVAPWTYMQFSKAVIRNGVTYIGDDAFLDCKYLTEITIPNSVTSMGWDVFSGCSSLKSVTIPKSINKIDTNAFSDCTSLRSIIIPDSVNYIVNGAFSGCPNLTIYGKKGSYAETYANNNHIDFTAFEIGDVNFNNAIDIKDVTEIQKSLVGLTELSDEQLAAADVNGDGKVDINDVTRLQMYLAFLIDELS